MNNATDDEDGRGDYESPSRLMSKDSVQSICDVLGLSKSTVNNYKPLKEPQRFGAGKVRAFSDDEKSAFLEIPDDLKNEMSCVPLRPETSITTEFDGYQWPYKPTAHDFEISKGEIKKRAAWSWYRTGLLYERTAQELRVEGLSQQVLGLRDLPKPRELLKQCIETLTERAAKAKCHALQLYPGLLHGGGVYRPSWAESLTPRDMEYYAEMAENHELVQRCMVARIYKIRAFQYILEAMSEFLESKEAERVKRTNGSFGTLTDCLINASTGHGGLLGLWGHVTNHYRDDKNFRRWWVRAAMARGHAEWLEKEPYKKYRSQYRLPKAPLEAWRLAIPRSPEGYSQNCVPYCLWHITKDRWPEDEYESHYWSIWDGLDEIGYVKHGDYPLASLFGPPAFVHLDTSERGWADELFGLIPDITAKQFEQDTCFQQRYNRKGIIDTLPETASDYEKALATCADDVVFEQFASLVVGAMCASDLKVGNAKQHRDAMLSTIRLIVERRASMTASDAEQCGFQTAVSDVVHHYSALLSKNVQSGYFFLVIKLQQDLRELLAPWLLVKVFTGLDGSWKWGFAKPGQPVAKPQSPSILETLPMLMDMGRIMAINSKIETLRSRILRNETLVGDDRAFALCFRQFLETGQESEMPLMAMGMRRRRDITLAEFDDKTAIRCAPGCTCSWDGQRAQRKRVAAARKSNDPEMMRERAMIRAWFLRMDGPLKALPTRFSPNAEAPSALSTPSTLSARSGPSFSRLSKQSTLSSGRVIQPSPPTVFSPKSLKPSPPTITSTPSSLPFRPAIPPIPPDRPNRQSRLLRPTASVPAMRMTPSPNPVSELMELENAGTDDYGRPIITRGEKKRNRLSTLFRRMF